MFISLFSFKIMANFRVNNATEATRARNRRKKLGRELVRRMHEINRVRRIELKVKRKNPLVRLIRLSEDEIHNWTIFPIELRFALA